jgi:hypothetical protein
MSSVETLHALLGRDLLAALSNDDGEEDVDEAILQELLTRTEEEVRDLLALTSDLSPVLEDIVATLSIERLFLRRRGALPQEWERRAELARLALRGLVRRGSVQPLPLSAPAHTHSSLRGL